MIETEPVWRFRSERALTQWYDYVHLLPDCVVGQWFRVERTSGELVWQKDHFRANSICGIDSGVIVAYEMRSDGPWTAGFGCYGISLDSGEIVWRSHNQGSLGLLGRLLDCIPGFTNDLRDSPSYVVDGQVFCSSGRVLNVTDGTLLSKIDSKDVGNRKPVPSDAWLLYRATIDDQVLGVPVGELTLAHANRGIHKGALHIVATTKENAVAWEFDIRQTGLHIESNFYSYRLAAPYVYFVVSEEPPFVANSARLGTITRNPTRWYILCLDVRNGQIEQRVSLGERRSESCRIEDVDERGLLIRISERELALYRRAS